VERARRIAELIAPTAPPRHLYTYRESATRASAQLLVVRAHTPRRRPQSHQLGHTPRGSSCRCLPRRAYSCGLAVGDAAGLASPAV